MARSDRHHAEDPEPAADLNLGLTNNGRIVALVDARARIVWGCFPDFQGDPLFSRLLDDRERGYSAIDIDDCVAIEREYLRNTAILRTTGGAVQIGHRAYG